MQIKLVINGVDFSPWVAEDGLAFGETYRQSRDVVVRDGTLYRAQISKMTLGVSLVELRDNTLALLVSALKSANPATVQTTREGLDITRRCYYSDISYSAKVVTGGNTYYSGSGFVLEEK